MNLFASVYIISLVTEMRRVCRIFYALVKFNENVEVLIEDSPGEWCSSV